MSTFDNPTAAEVYERHADQIEELAERNDEIGAAARAVLEVAGENDE